MTPDPVAFVQANTQLIAAPLVPEIVLHTATELTPIWEATERSLEQMGVDPPYWAFAWAGGQALARHILDHPDIVRGKRVLDFAAGSGMAGIAAAMAGAQSVQANEIDTFAAAAITLNARANAVVLDIVVADWVGGPNRGWDVVLAGDVCYERPMAERVEAWLKALAAAGAVVLMGDPKRTYLPKSGIVEIAKYSVPTTREIEDTDVRNAIVWRVGGG